MNQPAKKIYGVPLIVAQRVNKELEGSNDKVILLVLERMAIKAQQKEYREIYGVDEDWHARHKISGLYDRGCGCAYCQAVHRYVSTKITAHRTQRRLDRYDYMLHPHDNFLGFEQLKMLNKEWPKLREVSHQMKQLAGL